MSLPKAIARECQTRLSPIDHGLGLQPSQALAELGGLCIGSKYHSPRPLMTYRVAMPDGSTIDLCGTCRDNLRLLENLQDEDEPLPWDALREFGNRIRAISRGEDPDQ